MWFGLKLCIVEQEISVIDESCVVESFVVNLKKCVVGLKFFVVGWKF